MGVTGKKREVKLDERQSVRRTCPVKSSPTVVTVSVEKATASKENSRFECGCLTSYLLHGKIVGRQAFIGQVHDRAEGTKERRSVWAGWAGREKEGERGKEEGVEV